MKVKIWGCRGSLPSPGRETVIFGGESTCIEIKSDSGERIIIDAGSGIRKLGNSILKENDNKQLTILFTHAHWDHLSGFPFFKPAYRPDYSVVLCGGPVARDSIMNYLRHQMEPPYFPVDISEMKADFSAGCSCDKEHCSHIPGDKIKTINCYSVPLNHPNGGYGFKFLCDGKVFVFFPDNELRFAHKGGLSVDQYAEFCSGADLLIHDAQYTEEEYKKTRSWGHSTYSDAVDLAIMAGVKRLGLFHHDPDRVDDVITSQLDICKKKIIESGSSLECFACADGMLIDV